MVSIPSMAKKAPANKGKSRYRRTQSKLRPYLWVLPAALVYFVFKLAPMVGGVYLAMLRWDGIEPARFVGMGNLYRMFSRDKDILLALLHNVEYALGTVVGKIVLSLFLAVLLNQALRGRAFYRTSLFLPVVMSFVVIGVLWSWLYSPDFGLVNTLLRALGLDFLAQQWLGDVKVAMLSLVIVDIWKWYGFHMVIFLAGLQTIPADLYEAAQVDGASPWHQFWRITLPLLQPVMLVNVTLALMGGFNAFDIPWIMTQGGPAKATLVMALHVYLRAFKFNRFGYAALLNIVLLILVTIIAAIQMKLMTRGDTTRKGRMQSG